MLKMSTATSVFVRPYLRILPSRRSRPLRRSGYPTVPGLTMLKNWTGAAPEKPRANPTLVSPDSRNAVPVRLWFVMDGKFPPGYGRLWNVPLMSTSTFGTLYDARPFRFVSQPDSRWQNDCGICARPPMNGEPKPSEPPLIIDEM